MSPVAAPARPTRAPGRKQQPRPARPALYVVEPAGAPAAIPSTRRAPSRGTITIMAVAGLFVVLFAVAVLQTVLVQGQMQLDDLEQQISDQQAEAQRLRLEAASLTSPAHVVGAAQQMGMVAPEGGPTFVPTVTGDEVPTDPGLPTEASTAGQMAGGPTDAPPAPAP